MRSLLLLALPTLTALSACSSSRNLSVGESEGTAKASDACSGPCRADVRCLPNGHTLITCTGPAGKRCEIELACDEDSCEVVRCEGDRCCAGAGACKPSGR